MSLKEEAKAAEASLRKVIKDSEQLGWLTVMARYNGEIRSNLQIARADVERLTNESKSCKDRAISAEAKVEGLQTMIESLKQQLVGLRMRKPRPAAPASRKSSRVEFRGPDTSPATASMRQLTGLMIWPGMQGLGAHPRILPDSHWVDEMVKHAAACGEAAALEDLLIVLRQSEPYLLTPPGPEALRLAAKPMADRGRHLPAPRVALVTNNSDPNEWTPEDVLALALNPVYAGLPGFPALVSQETWIASALAESRRSSFEQVLVDILCLLKQVYLEPGVTAEE